MKTIDSNTKISTIIKEHPDALEAIVSISPKFNKLKNPLIRKLMASRTSIYMASKVGGCTVDDFFEKLEPLGFNVDKEKVVDDAAAQNDIPEFVKNITPDKTVELDVREDINSGKDPLSLIMKTIKQLQAGQVLKLINSFDPVPLVILLGKQGFESYTETINDNLVYTYFYQSKGEGIKEVDTSNASEGWDDMLQRFDGKTETVDVRELEMPLPMLTILEALDNLSDDKALYVIHKRIPVFLLPELATRKFDYRINEVGDGEVYLLIFKA